MAREATTDHEVIGRWADGRQSRFNTFVRRENR